MGHTAVVVGAGVGGLCCAVGLRSLGWQVTVVERWHEVVTSGAGLGIWPDAQLALERLGLRDAFLARAVELGEAAFFTAAGRRLAPVPLRRVERREGRPPRILPLGALLSLLLDAARDVPIRTGVDVSDRPDLLDGADLVVGADGLRSAVRAMAMPDARTAPRFAGVVAWRGVHPRDLDPADYGETWGPGCLVGLTRLAPGATNWYVALRTPSPQSVPPWPEVRTRLVGWRRPIPDVLATSDPGRVLCHPVWDLAPHLPRYVTGTVALVGDAAHAMTPSLGRGACEAILDADALVTCLAGQHDVATALVRYDATRRRRTQRTVARSRRALALSTTRHTRARDGIVRALAPLLR